MWTIGRKQPTETVLDWLSPRGWAGGLNILFQITSYGLDLLLSVLKHENKIIELNVFQKKNYSWEIYYFLIYI